MTQGNYYDYKTGAIASLPSGMTYNSDIARFVVNGRNFFTYEDAEWYLNYLIKFGFSVGFDPATLFASGEEGALFLPGPTTSFLSTTDLTPCGAGDTVGFQLDTSQGAGYSGGSFTGLGSELVTNGTFDSDTSGWTAGDADSIVSWSAGNIRITNGDATPAYALAGITPVVGRAYSVKATCVSSSGLPNVRLLFAGYDTTGGGVTVGDTIDIVVIATATTDLVLSNDTASSSEASGGWSEWDNISVRELPGNHATQGTAAARPVLARVPSGGRRNLLEYTEEFDNADWGKSTSTVTANTVSAPDGTTTADTFTTTATVYSSVFQTVTTVASTTYTASVYAKAGTASTLSLEFRGSGSTPDAFFNLSTGTVTSGAGIIEDAGDGWYRCSITKAAVDTSGLFIIARGTSGLIGDTIYLWGAQLEEGSTATAYQKVVSEYDVTEAGVDSLWYLDFDGVDDFMVTPTIAPGVDKTQVFAGVRKLSDAAHGVIAGTFATGSAGLLELSAPRAAGQQYGWVSYGSAAAITAVSSGYAAPITNVLTALGDISGDLAPLRIDGNQVAQSTTDQGTGNYLAYPLYIGARAGTSLFFDGHIYSLIVRFGANLTSGEISNTETFFAARSGVESRTEVTWDSTADTYTQSEVFL